MRANSLALRLFFSAATWTVIILVITLLVLRSSQAWVYYEGERK